jgi:hypothetical protein
VIYLSQAMRTIPKSDFTFFFMSISKKLTLAELRLLYLLITEPTIIELPQQEIADKIGANRRTVNIGLKKLKHQNFIWDLNVEDREKKMANYQAYTKQDESVMDKQILRAKQLVTESYMHNYHHDKPGEIIVNEDFFSSILGDFRLPQMIRYNKDFITNTLAELYPKCKFYFKQRKSSYRSEVYYNIIHSLNYELLKARSFNRYFIERADIMETITNKNPINEMEVLKVIRKDFPLVVIAKNRLRIPKPWTGKD